VKRDRGNSAEDIAALLADRLPGADRGRLSAQVEALNLTAAHTGGLLRHLRSHPDALTSGAAAGPAALRALLDVLATQYPGVQRVRCHGCGEAKRLPYRRDGASICGSCYRRTHLKVCGRCGELGSPARREGGVTVCMRCDRRDPTRHSACTRCGTVAVVAYRVDGNPFCQNCGPRKLSTCSSCGAENQRVHALTNDGPICPRCYRRSHSHQCHQCGRVSARARVADRAAGTWVCQRCWEPPTATCSGCGRQRPCARGVASGRPVCSTCRRGPRRPRPCAICERTKAVAAVLPRGTVCGPCIRQLRRHPAPCTACGHVSTLVGVDDGGNGVCGPCSGDGRNWTCEDCGQVDLLLGSTRCLACTVKARVIELLGGPDGQIDDQLQGLWQFLIVDNPPERTLDLLRGSEWVRILGELITEHRRLTHEVLDELALGRPVEHLRIVLVHTGALEPRDDNLEPLDAWLKKFLTTAPREDVHLLRTYGQWSVLPRTRRRAARLGATASTPKYARTRIETAAHFLAWLRDNNRTLAEATQHDVDTWIASGASTRRRVGDFLAWTHARGLSTALQVRWLGREGLAEHVLGDDERWKLLRRCLRDDNLALHLRVAGALVLLYGQIPTRIAELTIDDVTTTDTDTFVVLQKQPVLLPPPLGALTAELAARGAGEQSNTQPGRPGWLFPGARPGTHAYPGRLATALNQKAGIFVRPGRGSALNALAADLPAPVLAELLGFSITTATRWSALAARDNADYVAARIANPPT
jgi:hypothetical protein